MAEYLVEIGIDSMSLTPDSVLRTMRAVLEVERRLGRPAPGRASAAEA
jgi:pyruvate,water dikinase